MRRPAGAAVRICLPAAAVLLLLAACSGTAGAGGSATTKPTAGETGVSSAPVVEASLLRCGEPFRPATGGPLTLAADFPATLNRGAEPVLGTVEATSPAALHAVGPGRAEAFLVRDGRLVTLPVPQDSVGVLWDLAAGEARSVPADASLVSCAAGGGALEPGTYDLYVRVVLTPDDGGLVESVGGPWSLQVS
jgi:hypothetical protein